MPEPLAHLVPNGGNTCDFCNTTPVFKTYRCEKFELKGVHVFNNSEGMWTACRNCSEFVDAGEWASLAERAFQNFMKHHAVPRHSAVSVRIQFSDVVRLFAAHKQSDEYPNPPERMDGAKPNETTEGEEHGNAKRP